MPIISKPLIGVKIKRSGESELPESERPYTQAIHSNTERNYHEQGIRRCAYS
jgi:hypothetical protein